MYSALDLWRVKLTYNHKISSYRSYNLIKIELIKIQDVFEYLPKIQVSNQLEKIHNQLLTFCFVSEVPVTLTLNKKLLVLNQ